MKDTGICIRNEQFKNIFEAFKKLENTKNQNYGNTELGLNISQQIVRLVGSKLLVKSGIDVGSHFHFTLEL